MTNKREIRRVMSDETKYSMFIVLLFADDEPLLMCDEIMCFVKYVVDLWLFYPYK